VLDTPKQVVLPESVVESKPRETVVIFISPDEVLVQGESMISTAEIFETPGSIAPIVAKLSAIKNSIIGPSTQVVAASQEVTILADKSIPFDVIKKVMSTCTSEGFTKISLAVTQKASQVVATEV